MSTPRSLALLDALERVFTARQWSNVRTLYHDEALLRTGRSARSQVVVTESLRRWWLERFTLDEIRVLAAGLDG